MRLSALANQIFVEDTENGISGNGDGNALKKYEVRHQIFVEEIQAYPGLVEAQDLECDSFIRGQ